MVSIENHSRGSPVAFAALLLGNVALAGGPFLVRHSGVGPIGAGFWRLALAVPFLWAMARVLGQPVRWPGRRMAGALWLAAFFFATDLAAWHQGILLTKLGNATLFGNISSFLFAAWGLWLARRWPSPLQALALALAAAGCGLLLFGSAELGARYLRGDLLAAMAGLLYTGYLIIVERSRGSLRPLPLLAIASLFGAAMLLPMALAAGETVLPTRWTGVVALALCSQVIGQGLLVYALGHVPPLVAGVAMLTQPALSAFLGWRFHGETLTALDGLGAVLIVVALVLVRLRGGAAGPKEAP